MKCGDLEILGILYIDGWELLRTLTRDGAVSREKLRERQVESKILQPADQRFLNKRVKI